MPPETLSNCLISHFPARDALSTVLVLKRPSDPFIGFFFLLINFNMNLSVKLKMSERLHQVDRDDNRSL